MAPWQLPPLLLLCCGLSAAFPGRSFLAVFPQNDDQGTGAHRLLLLLTAPGQRSDVTVTAPGSSFEVAVAVERGRTVPVAVPPTMELAGSSLSPKVLSIRATKDVTVVAHSSKIYTVGATALLPVAKLGRRYLVVTPQGTGREGLKEFAVAAGAAAAKVTVKANGRFYYNGRSYSAGSTLRVALNPYHSFQIQSGADLTGTEVTSDAAVAVFAGHTCVKVRAGCDHAVEQLLPVAAWGDAYVVAPNPAQKYADLAYVVAAEAATVTYRQGGVATTQPLAAGAVQKVEVRRQRPLHITASAPVQVVFFFTGSRKGSARQNPFMVAIPPVSAYCTSHRVGDVDGTAYHVVLTARGAGTAVVSEKVTRNVSWDAVAGTDFTWAALDLVTEAEIRTTEPHGLVVFGFKNYGGYGFAAFCAADSPPPSCDELACKESCEVVDGRATCVPAAVSTCRAAGNVHYRTFGGKNFVFAGRCAYTLAKPCRPDPALPAFSVEATNEPRGKPEVATIVSVAVHVYGVTVEAVKSETGIVRVNNRRSHLPVVLANGKLHLLQKGRALLLTADFGLKVSYDWDDRVVVKLPAALASQACGACGDPSAGAGQVAVDLAQEASDELRRCRDACGAACEGRRGDDVARYRVDTLCGLLARRGGPFERCHGAVDPAVYVDNCAHDLAVNGGERAALCRALQAYADDCREEGVSLPDWRTSARCPLSCPENSYYAACGPACPTTCNDKALPDDCAAPYSSSSCLETCECHEGFVLDAGRCVPRAECGCVFQDLLHGLQEDFWPDDTCTKSCSCLAGQGSATCHWAGCRAGEECRLEDGIHGCHPKSYGTCSAVGATHYESFDGRTFVFQGTCEYLLAGSRVENPELVGFQVLVRNGHGGHDLVASIAGVTVKVYGKTIAISQEHPGKIQVNDQLVNLPYRPGDGHIAVYRGGQEVVVETDFGLTVTSDWSGRVTVSVPSSYANALRGLCGNYNGDVGDDATTESGQKTADPDVFGRGWKVTDVPGCVELSTVECPPASVARWSQEAAKRRCGIVLKADGPFRACHAVVDAKRYFQNCLHDSCLFPEQGDAICPVIASYVAACQAAGAAVGTWRTEGFCGISCPPNSHYQTCTTGCHQTCDGTATEKCSEKCREGCACNEGFVLSGDECVPASRCGCFHNDFYYKVEESFFPTKEEKCRCHAGGTVTCEKLSCPGGGKGEVVDGVFQCQPTAPGVCVALGDRSYLSFDGVAFNISGTCSYILTETCTDNHGEPFVVKIKKDARQKGKVSGIHELSVEVHGLTLTLTRGKRGDVMVDSVSHRLPAVLSEGRVRVQRHGLGVLVQTDFGLIIRYDLLHRVAVTVPRAYQGHLCGLCGNFNGRGHDDFLLPEGQPAPDATVFGSTWKTPDVACSDTCPEADCPACTKKKEAALQKPNYCGVLTAPKGPFASCHRVVDPTFYLQACLHDLCLANGDTQVLCQSIQSYATACQDAGAMVEAWRRPNFCPLECPPNSTYSLCTNLCAASCESLRDAFECPATCVEGCRCDHGATFNGHHCVPVDQCGCFADGEYYEPHESRLKDNCHRRCTCVPGEGVACEDHACPDDETCEILDGVLRCLNPNPCKAVQCRPKERCKLEDGRATCIPVRVATCWAWGDPHYRTFDGRDFDFQGTCTYVMAEAFGDDATLVPFRVEAKNDVWGGVNVSYVALVNVKVYGHRVSIRRKEVGKVRVDGVTTLLPATLAEGKLRMAQSGLRAILETDFGLRVAYDWTWHLVVDLPSSYYKQTRGLCGDFNMAAEDDAPGTADAAAVAAWAKGAKVEDDEEADDPFCWDYCEGSCPVCEEEKRELYGGHHYCGLLKKRAEGPFGACHGLVAPRDFYRHCLYDVCVAGGAKKILCQVLEAYAATCKKAGAAVGDWRTPAGCPLPCPPHSHYEPCGSACPPTCAAPAAAAPCPLPCVETCACDPGYVLLGGRCVDAITACGCALDGRYHPPGEEFFADASCRKRCRCDAALGMVTCEEAGCRRGERCKLVGGARRCVAAGRSVCVATGDPHYTTFDGRRYDFMGTCVYQLAALCAPNPALVPFNVTVENNHRGSHLVSYTKEVTLHVYNVTLSLSQEHPQQLKVDGLLVELPFSHADKLHAYISGVHGFIKTDFGLRVTFNWHSYARVILPSTYAGAVCGLCGDADGDADNDLVTRDGRRADDELQFADSWKVADVPGCSPGCGDGCRLCSDAQKRPYRGDKHCGLLVKTRGPFAACHGAVAPQPYFDDCLFDACVYEGHQDTVCRAVAAYVTACQSRGVAIRPWRTDDFCSPTCPPNQHYELCGPPCPPTCRDQDEAPSCEAEPSSCVEGCFCDAGLVLSGRRCVPASRCGCSHHGRYYAAGEEFVPAADCATRCVCKGAEGVECRPAAACGEDEECRVEEGRRGCHPRRCGRCETLGAVSYRAFDGRRGAVAASCGYTLAEVTEGDAPFAVKVEKDEEGAEVRRVVVAVGGVDVVLESGVSGEVTVSGERHLLPLALPGGAVTATQEGAHRVLRLPGRGPKILYDGSSYVLVTLPAASRPGGVCGALDGVAAAERPGCATPPPDDCAPDVPDPCEALEASEGPFGACHGLVAPGDYAAACRRERCGSGGRDGAKMAATCRALQAYAAACQAAGGVLREWREEARCPFSCPPNSHYELCTRSCDASCAALVPGAPPCSQKCFEGCRCDEGLLADGPDCVTPDACGCFHHGRYFQIAETILSADCSERCTCHAAGGVQCSRAGCRAGQSCVLQDGVRRCVDLLGRCVLAPASRFVTFDGAEGSSVAAGIYVVATSFELGGDGWFRLLAQVEETWEGPHVAALHVYVPGAFVTVTREKKVWVNGVAAALPVTAAATLNVTESAGAVAVTPNPQATVALEATGEATVTAAPELRRRLGGLCGDFDGDAGNDLRGPDGKLVATAAAAARAWRAPDFSH